MKAFIVVLLALVTMAAAADVHRRLFLRKCVMSVAISQKSLMISFPGVILSLSLCSSFPACSSLSFFFFNTENKADLFYNDNGDRYNGNILAIFPPLLN